MITRTLAAGLAAAAFFAFAPASADSSMSVAVDRAALSEPAAAKDFYRALKRDIRRMCRKEIRRSGVYVPVAARECARATLADAVVQIDAPLITAMHTGERPRRRFAMR